MSNPTHRRISTGSFVYPAGEPEDDLEELPEGYWEAAELAEARAKRWAAVKAEREARRVIAPFAVAGGPAGEMDCDETGRSNILGMLQAIDYLGEGVAEPITWKLHDNSFAAFTRDHFKAAALQVLAHIQSCYVTSFGLEAAIMSAETLEDIGAVVWPGT